MGDNSMVHRLSSVTDSMTDSADDAIYDGDEIAINLLHGTVSNIVVEDEVIRHSDSAYSSQGHSSHTNEPPVFPEQSIRQTRPPSPTIQEKYNSTNDPFKKVTMVVAHGCIHNESISQDPKEQKIFDTVQRLTEKMRNESPTHFENFVKRLKRAFENSQTVDPIVWFSLSFEELIKKVGESPSWRSFANMLNCIYIVKMVAKDHYNHELKTSMEKCLIGFICDHFKLFINGSGGWEKIHDYVRHVESHEQNRIDNNGGWLATLVPAAMVVGAVALGLRR